MTHAPLAQAIFPPVRSQAAGLGRDTLLVLTFSLVTALSAQIALHLPWTSVPITGQTFGVLLTGALLGPRLGFASLLLYLAEGTAGLPFFAGGTFGMAHLVGPTGGYLLAFPFAAALAGGLAARGWDRRPWTMLAAMLLGTGVIYLFGAAHLSHFVGVRRAFTWAGVLPFLPGDTIKALLAAGLLPLGRAWTGRKG